MELTTQKLFVDVPLEAEAGLVTPVLSIKEYLAIDDGRVRIGASKDDEKNLSVFYKRDWKTENAPTFELVSFRGEKDGEYDPNVALTEKPDNWSVGMYVLEAVHL
jgi:hypothetical protein